jgi:hypothetical protein
MTKRATQLKYVPASCRLSPRRYRWQSVPRIKADAPHSPVVDGATVAAPALDTPDMACPVRLARFQLSGPRAFLREGIKKVALPTPQSHGWWQGNNEPLPSLEPQCLSDRLTEHTTPMSKQREQAK